MVYLENGANKTNEIKGNQIYFKTKKIFLKKKKKICPYLYIYKHNIYKI